MPARAHRIPFDCGSATAIMPLGARRMCVGSRWTAAACAPEFPAEPPPPQLAAARAADVSAMTAAVRRFALGITQDPFRSSACVRRCLQTASEPAASEREAPRERGHVAREPCGQHAEARERPVSRHAEHGGEEGLGEAGLAERSEAETAADAAAYAARRSARVDFRTDRMKNGEEVISGV